MTNKPYDVINKEEPRGQSVTYKGIPCTARTCVTSLNRLTEENEQLKYQNELLSDELEQCKALINKKWSEYLQKKELEECQEKTIYSDKELSKKWSN